MLLYILITYLVVAAAIMVFLRVRHSEDPLHYALAPAVLWPVIPFAVARYAATEYMRKQASAKKL